MSVRNAYLYLRGLAVRSTLPCALVLVASTCGSALLSSEERPNSSGLLSRLAAAGAGLVGVWVVLTVAIMLPSAYAQSSYPVGRALVGAGFLATLVLAGLGTMAGVVAGIWLGRSRLLRIALLALLLAAVAPFPLWEARGALAELPRYRRWSSFWDARDSQIREARDRGVADMDVLELDKVIPDVPELQPDANFWYNNCAEWLYDLRSLSASLPGWDG
jgi:hypothetical protein